ncbi:ogr/Delta-like zinc finger family protein [Acinetobacter brisouii]|uniref:ogr/Delta-like zinc finger family protein n=1 Tax=Acinetobacter brisouii TaxID=396323 RepID=UPI00124EF701|nr:ogr/Delta-like zinc finger family protein [Acinetobacter brisouii]
MTTNVPFNKMNKNNSRPQIDCPHCKTTKLKIRSSEQTHPLLKSIWLTCPNLFCGFTCGGHIEITHTCSPSSTPDPNIKLPTLLEIKAANDDTRE